VKAGYQTPRIIRSSAPMLAASIMAAFLLCAGTASAQSCPSTVAPGEMQSFSQASGGNATPLFGPTTINFAAFVTPGGGGIDDPANNKVEAAAVIPLGWNANVSASAEIDYEFCVSGRTPNDTVPATISAQAYWNGVLFALAAVSGSANTAPSASTTMTLFDLGTNSPVAATTVLQTNFSLSGIKGIGLGGTSVTQTSSAMLSANVVTGHRYQIQYQLVCQAPSGAGIDIGCDFGSDVLSGLGPICSGGCFSILSGLSITLGKDLYGEVLQLSAQITANSQAIAAAKLTAEQENAQILGILNEIKALLSALQAAPSAPRALKADPPNRPTSPRPPPRIIPEQ
jgi:hypothetical protein